MSRSEPTYVVVGRNCILPLQEGKLEEVEMCSTGDKDKAEKIARGLNSLNRGHNTRQDGYYYSVEQNK